MKLVISTIGTSLLTNRVNIDERRLLNNYSNHKKELIPNRDLAIIEGLIANAREKIKDTDLSKIQSYSAELNGIISYYNYNFSANKGDNHLLITTDTFEGEETAKIVNEYLQQQGLNSQVFKIAGMNTSNSDSFQEGIKKLIVGLYNIVPSYKQQKYDIIFNLTGGFKAIQAYLNTLGMFLADELVYLFETGSIISIPKMPVKLDNKDLMKEFSTYFGLLDNSRILQSKNIDSRFFEEVSTVYYNSIEIENEKFVELSAWGIIMWNENKREIFQEGLIEYPNFIYTDEFIKSYKKSESDKKDKLQETLGKVAELYLSNEVSVLKKDGGIQYEDYKNERVQNRPIGHFRVSQPLRVNCFEWNNELYLLEFGEHGIEDNLTKYKNLINKIIGD